MGHACTLPLPSQPSLPMGIHAPCKAGLKLLLLQWQLVPPLRQAPGWHRRLRACTGCEVWWVCHPKSVPPGRSWTQFVADRPRKMQATLSTSARCSASRAVGVRSRQRTVRVQMNLKPAGAQLGC